MSKLSRRQLLVLAGATITLGVGSAELDSPHPDDVGGEAFAATLSDQFYRRETAADLPDPDAVPAIGVTNQGLYEYRDGGDEWESIPLGTDDAPIPQGNFESLSTREFSVEPVKVGLLADPHYPGQAPKLGAVGGSGTREKLREFVADVNDWGADRVFFMGDMMPEWGGREKSQNKIRELRRLVEDELEMPAHMVWGNHEYQNADDWGSDWSYEPWGVSEDADTWYAVDASVAKIIVLNNGYSDTGHVHTKFLAEQIEWLREELNATRRPVVVISHLPLSTGTGQQYDHAENEERVGRLLSRYDNVVCCLFGHCHHDNSVAPDERDQPPFFDRMREQRRYGMRHLFVPWIHRLEWDDSYTPWGKLYLYPDGNARLEASYADTDTREEFVVNGQSRPPRFAEDEYLRPARERLEWETHFDSVDGFGTDAAGDGAIALRQQGVELTTGDSGGGVLLRKVRGFESASNPVMAGWTNCVWRCHVNPGAVQDAAVELLWGDPETNYVGYRIEEGTVRGVREDGDGEVETKKIDSLDDGEPRLFQLFYSVDFDRLNFVVGPRGTRPKTGLTPGSPDGRGSSHALTASIESDAGDQRLTVGWAAVHKHPDLMIRQ